MTGEWTGCAASSRQLKNASALRVVTAASSSGESPRAPAIARSTFGRYAWFVASTLWARLHVARQQIGGVALDQQTVGGNFPDDFTQVQTASFVADPSRDADIEVQFEIGARFSRSGREAMSDAAREPRSIVAHDRKKLFVSIALMEEHRLLQFDCKRQLFTKRSHLRIVRREIPVVIEPALADCDDLRLTRQVAQFTQLRGVKFGGMVRMNAGRTAKTRGTPPHEIDRGVRAGDRAARDHHARDAGGRRPLDD